jgi:hypothetical protein
MWKPKTKEELLKEERKKEKDAKLLGVFVFLFIPFMLTVLNKFIGTQAYRGAPLGPTLSWATLLRTLPFMFSMSSIFGILMYLTFRKYKYNSTQVCPKCGKLKQVKKNENCDCDCGGKFRLLSEMKWVENDKVQQNKEE